MWLLLLSFSFDILFLLNIKFMEWHKPSFCWAEWISVTRAISQGIRGCFIEYSTCVKRWGIPQGGILGPMVPNTGATGHWGLSMCESGHQNEVRKSCSCEPHQIEYTGYKCSLGLFDGSHNTWGYQAITFLTLNYPTIEFEIPWHRVYLTLWTALYGRLGCTWSRLQAQVVNTK